MDRILLLILILYAITGCKKEESVGEEGSDYFPLAMGNRWVYRGGLAGEFSETITYEVSGSENLPRGKPAWEIIRSWKTSRGSLADTFYMYSQEGNLRLYFDRSDTLPEVILQYPLEIGKKWISAGIFPEKYRESMVEGVEEVNVPMRSFERSIKVESSEHLSQRETSLETPGLSLENTALKDTVFRVIRDWYAPNVGRVKSEMEARSDVYTLELIDCTLH